MMQGTLRRLRAITDGCRDDMHEPDEQGIVGGMRGHVLDNAMGDDPTDNCGELTVCIARDPLGGEDALEEWFNLATLIALARKAYLPGSGEPVEPIPTTEEDVMLHNINGTMYAEGPPSTAYPNGWYRNLGRPAPDSSSAGFLSRAFTGKMERR